MSDAQMSTIIYSLLSLSRSVESHVPSTYCIIAVPTQIPPQWNTDVFILQTKKEKKGGNVKSESACCHKTEGGYLQRVRWPHQRIRLVTQSYQVSSRCSLTEDFARCQSNHIIYTTAPPHNPIVNPAPSPLHGNQEAVCLGHGGDGVVRRAHLCENLVQPLQRSVEVDLDPAGGAGHVLTMVFSSPALGKEISISRDVYTLSCQTRLMR